MYRLVSSRLGTGATGAASGSTAGVSGNGEINFDDFSPVRMDKYAPVYEEIPGWKKDISNVRKQEDLPEETLNYLSFVQEYLKVSVVRVGVGQRRDQTITLNL